MPFCLICFLCKLRRSQPISPGQHNPSSSNLMAELEDSRRFALNSLMALLAILTISGSRVLQPVALTLLIYTITLRLAINTCFLHNYSASSRFLHAIPSLGTFCMAAIELISDTRSPALAAVGMLLGMLPLVIITIHHGEQCTEMSTEGLPMQMQDVPATVISNTV